MSGRVLALVGEAYGGNGGIAQYNRDFFGALGSSGYTIDILPRHGGDHPLPAPAHVRQAQPRRARLPYALKAIGAARRTRPDIVFCGHLFMAPLAGMLARRSGAKLVIQAHGIDAWTMSSPAAGRAVARADLITCVSRDTRNHILSWADIPPERVVVLANTVSAEFTPGDRKAARAKWALGAETVLVSVGRLATNEQYKGQDRVIAALPSLPANVIYLVAGDGDDRPRLEALARDKGVADRVRFLGSVSHADLADLYRAADLFVLPSTGEGFGIVFLEAMACGTPAMGLAIGGATDALGDGDLGYAVSEAEFAAKLAEQIQKPPPAGLSQEVGWRFGADRFDIQLSAFIGRLVEHNPLDRPVNSPAARPKMTSR